MFLPPLSHTLKIHSHICFLDLCLYELENSRNSLNVNKHWSVWKGAKESDFEVLYINLWKNARYFNDELLDYKNFDLIGALILIGNNWVEPVGRLGMAAVYISLGGMPLGFMLCSSWAELSLFLIVMTWAVFFIHLSCSSQSNGVCQVSTVIFETVRPK